MKSNFWEELVMTQDDMKKEVKDFHKKSVEKMNLPEWSRITCPYCNNKIESSGIRNISCCFNARNIGDISVNFNCDSCQVMNTVYFRNEVSNDITEFADLLLGKKDIKSSPVIEETMYHLRYNNLIENLVKEK